MLTLWIIFNDETRLPRLIKLQLIFTAATMHKVPHMFQCKCAQNTRPHNVCVAKHAEEY